MIFLKGLFIVMGLLTLGTWTYLGILKIIWLCEDWHIEELEDKRDRLKAECERLEARHEYIKRQITG